LRRYPHDLYSEMLEVSWAVVRERSRGGASRPRYLAEEEELVEMEESIRSYEAQLNKMDDPGACAIGSQRGRERPSLECPDGVYGMTLLVAGSRRWCGYQPGMSCTSADVTGSQELRSRRACTGTGC